MRSRTSLPKAVGVRLRVAGLEDAAVDAATHVFDEGSEQLPLDRRDAEVGIQVTRQVSTASFEMLQGADWFA